MAAKVSSPPQSVELEWFPPETEAELVMDGVPTDHCEAHASVTVQDAVRSARTCNESHDKQPHNQNDLSNRE